MIGIIGALEEEVQALRERMQEAQIETHTGNSFYRGKIAGQEIVVASCGVGKVNAAVCAQILVDKFDIDALINTGVAGGLRADVHVGDIVLSREACYHDFDLSPLGFAKGEIMGMGTSVFPADEALLARAYESCGRVLEAGRYHIGRVVSGDQFIAGQENQTRLREEWGGSCAEMEGAAIAHVGYLNQIPWLIIRAISDGANDDSPMDYNEFKTMAIETGIRLMMDMLENWEMLLNT